MAPAGSHRIVDRNGVVRLDERRRPRPAARIGEMLGERGGLVRVAAESREPAGVRLRDPCDYQVIQLVL